MTTFLRYQLKIPIRPTADDNFNTQRYKACTALISLRPMLDLCRYLQFGLMNEINLTTLRVRYAHRLNNRERHGFPSVLINPETRTMSILLLFRTKGEVNLISLRYAHRLNSPHGFPSVLINPGTRAMSNLLQFQSKRKINLISPLKHALNLKNHKPPQMPINSGTVQNGPRPQYQLRIKVKAAAARRTLAKQIPDLISCMELPVKWIPNMSICY